MSVLQRCVDVDQHEESFIIFRHVQQQCAGVDKILAAGGGLRPEVFEIAVVEGNGLNLFCEINHGKLIPAEIP